MNDDLAERLLCNVMDWEIHEVTQERSFLQAMAAFKYDEYHQFTPGMKFIESFALWLYQFTDRREREIAYNFIKNRLIFISSLEMMHLVSIAYADCIKPLLIKRVAYERGCSHFNVSRIAKSEDFHVLKRQSLFLGLSDGARIGMFRRFSRELSHEQIWAMYDISGEKAKDMHKKLRKDLSKFTGKSAEPRVKAIFLLDDFSGSGTSYLRIENNTYKGKIHRVYHQLCGSDGVLKPIVSEDFMVYIILYVSTERAVHHIHSMMKNLFGNRCEHGVKAIQCIDSEYNIGKQDEDFVENVIEKYYDSRIEDEDTRRGGTKDLKFGFAQCGLPLVLHHNTPNNSIGLLWSYENEDYDLHGLFPRVTRHGVI